MTSTKIKLNFEKYITPGEKEKLEYPKPQKSKTIKYISKPDLESDLEFPSKREASKDAEKLLYNKKVEFPEISQKIETDTKTVKKYISEGEYGDISKSKGLFEPDVESEKAKVDISKYYLKFETAKPFQKQFSKKKLNNFAKQSTTLPDVIGYTFISFLKWAQENPEGLKNLLDKIDTYQYYDIEVLKKATLNKMAGRSLQEWLDYLKSKKVPRKIRRKFKHIWESALERGESEEYAARAAIDILPKNVLEKPTEYHGPEKTGPIKKGSIDDEIAELQKRITELNQELVEAQNRLAELQSKKAEELSKNLNK